MRESRKVNVFIAHGIENAAAQGSKSSILRHVKVWFKPTVAAKRKVWVGIGAWSSPREPREASEAR